MRRVFPLTPELSSRQDVCYIYVSFDEHVSVRRRFRGLRDDLFVCRRDLWITGRDRRKRGMSASCSSSGRGFPWRHVAIDAAGAMSITFVRPRHAQSPRQRQLRIICTRQATLHLRSAGRQKGRRGGPWFAPWPMGRPLTLLSQLLQISEPSYGYKVANLTIYSTMEYMINIKSQQTILTGNRHLIRLQCSFWFSRISRGFLCMDATDLCQAWLLQNFCCRAEPRFSF